MKKIISFVLLSVFCNTGYGQTTNIIIDSLYLPNEPSIAIDPKNPEHMVAGSNVNNVYRSVNGGLNWTRDSLMSSYGVFGDPVIVADTNGSFYYFHLARNMSIFTWPNWADRIVCQRLDDITTNTWTDGGFAGYVPTPGIADKPGVGIDRKTNTLYVTWTKFDRYGSANPSDSSNIFFSRSDDRGVTWSVPVRINNVAGNCEDDDPTVEGATPCAGAGGEIFVSWAASNEILFDRSSDGGATWLPANVHVTTVPEGWNYEVPGLNRCNGLPFTACDLSNGPYKNNVYINWTDQRNGTDNTDVWISRSADKGDTWSPPIKVNDDAGTAHQFFSSMTVDPANGYIYVLFYDRRNYAPDDSLTDVYLAVSRDGATTFENYRISEQPFRPSRKVFFGDYTYISAFNGVVRPIWGSLTVTGTGMSAKYDQKIMTAVIDETITKTATPNATQLQHSLSVFPNPFKHETNITYELPTGCQVSLTITDVTGRRVAILQQDQPMSAGKHVVPFNTAGRDIAPGLYFVQLLGDNFSQTQKLVLVQ